MRDDAFAPPAVAAFRRAEHIPTGYSPVRHIVQSSVIAGLIAVAAGYLARGATWKQWLWFPAFVLAANFIEWSFHKGPMHRPVGPRILYTNHSLIHHRAFIQTSMPVENARELGLIMMPWYTMLLLFALGSPVALAAWWLGGRPMVGIFYLMAVLYFFTYETLHALYHTPQTFQDRTGLARNRVFQALLAHHRHHHRLERMSHVNFNVTFPLWDTVMRTKERDGEEPVRHPRTAPKSKAASAA